MKREVFVCAAEAGNEVVFERANGTFGGIASVYMRRDQLIINLFGSEVVLESSRSFIVETLELGS